MIRLDKACRTEIRENMRGGDGSVKIEHFWEKDEMAANNRMVARLTLEPGCSIGFHRHETEDEIFIITKGCAEADDDGTAVTLNVGDTMLTGKGAGHSIRNAGDTTLEVIAFISNY